MLVIASYVLLILLSLHASVAGIALGVENSLATTTTLLIAIVAHKLLEAFALGNKPWPSFLDGLGNAAGYGWILIAVAFFRELLGSGTLLDIQVIPQAFYEAGYVNNGMMILPPMALVDSR